jgi:hypothetical protein
VGRAGETIGTWISRYSTISLYCVKISFATSVCHKDQIISASLLNSIASVVVAQVNKSLSTSDAKTGSTECTRKMVPRQDLSEIFLGGLPNRDYI